MQQLRADLLQVDGVPDRLCPAQGLLREGRRGRLREEADRLRPLHGRRISRATPSCGSRPIRTIGAASRRSRPWSSSSCPTRRAASPRSKSGSSDITLEMPYEEFDRLKDKSRASSGVATPISDIGMIFITNNGADARQERAARRDHGDRQEGDRRPAAARLRRADRDARGAGICGLRSLDQGRLRSEEGRRSCSPPPATRRRSRSSSRSRRRAASSRKTTR